MQATTPGQAHEIRPSVANITLNETDVRLEVFLVLEPLIAGMVLDGLDDTSQSPKAAEHDALRALSAAELADAFRRAWPGIASRIIVRAGTAIVPLAIESIAPGPVGNIDLPRDSTLVLSGRLPQDGSPVSVSWGRGLGLLALRQTGGEDAYEALIAPGETSAALPRVGSTAEPMLSFFMSYIKIGVEHIVPKGLDHILFVLGLFFFAVGMRPLLWQITTFTAAHTLTLALASLGVVSVPASIVEPLIALSIAYVAAENILGSRLGWRRIAVVFGFGLLHGLGFASVLGDVGLQPGRFVAGLIGFNVGVELGQLLVVLAAWLAVGWAFAARPWYRSRIAVPVSAVIGLVGLWWGVERTFL